MGDVITTGCSAWIGLGDEARTTSAELRYDPTRPLVVTLHAPAADATDLEPAAPAVTLEVSRDLLIDGCLPRLQAGEGLARVRSNAAITTIVSPDVDGTPRNVRVVRWTLWEFLRLTRLAVPRGQEELDVDSWLATLQG